jgi:hypothetical protein
MNALSTVPKDVLSSLNPGEVQAYLFSRGWSAVPYGRDGDGLLFHHLSMPEVDLLLPLKRDLRDYAARMKDLLVSLATIERRPVQEILNDLTGPTGDVFRFRVAGSVAALGNLPLDEAMKLLAGARQLLWSSAFSVIRAEALHPVRTVKQVDDFLKNCRFGQTERGSFVATILAPVPPEIQPPLTGLDAGHFEPEEPYARRVTTGLMSSLGLMAQQIRMGKPGELLNAVDQGISANLCDALAMLRPPGDESCLDIRVNWARTRPHIPVNVPDAVEFPQAHFAVIEEVGRQLRTRATAGPERFQGKVLSVKKALRPLLPEVTGWMVMAADVEGSRARVRVELRCNDFATACDALRNDWWVAVKGTIRHDVKTREYVLSDPSEFQVAKD